MVVAGGRDTDRQPHPKRLVAAVPAQHCQYVVGDVLDEACSTLVVERTIGRR